MKAKPADQSVRQALQVLRLAALSRQSVVVDPEGKLVYAKVATAAGSDAAALQQLTCKIEKELSRHAKGISEVRDKWIPQHLPSLASVKMTSDQGRLAAIENLTIEWHDFIKTHDTTAHREWQQTQVRRYDFLNRVDEGMPLGVKCSIEEGVVAASTTTLSPADAGQLLDRLTNSPYGQIDAGLGIAQQTVKDAPRTESIRIALPGSADGLQQPSTVELRFPTPEALIAALQALYERQQEIVRDLAAPDAHPAQDDGKANFVKLASLLTNQTAMNLLDDFRYKPGTAESGTAVIFNAKQHTETTRIHIDARGDLVVERARWERWNALICQDISAQAIPVNQGAHWDGPLDDTNFSFRAHISLRLRREDLAQGVFLPSLTRSPQLSACIELDWASIDPVLRRAADERRQRASQSSQEFSSPP